MVYMHRLLMAAPSGLCVDHIDGNTLDNRRANLRLATHSENLRNMKRKKNNRSGYRGVHRVRNRWCAQITCNRKVRTLGTFATAEEAHEAYVKAATELHGEFARP
jgi:hypothetical protein